jgi:hypothetical protein
MRILRDPVVVVTAVVVVVGVVVALLWGVRASDGVDTDPSGEQAVALDDVTDVSELVGRTVVADRAQVISVPDDEGFWISTAGEPAWVQIAAAGESPVRVDAGDEVGFTGAVVRHDADFADRDGMSTADAAQLAEAGAHIEVQAGDLVVNDD